MTYEIKEAKILVTGGHGLVGSAIQRVIERDSLGTGFRFFFPTKEQMNVLDFEQVNSVFQEIKPDVVIHLAAKVGGLFHNQNNNLDYYKANTAMSNNIFDACSLNNVKLTVGFLSTCIYPVGLGGDPLDEDDLHLGEPHQSNYGYAFGKRQHEILARLWNEGLPQNKHYCLVPPNIYGINDNFNPATSHVIPGIIGKMYNASNTGLGEPGPTLILPGSGQALRQFVYSEDIAKQTLAFVMLLLQTPDRKNIPTVLNIGTNSSYTIAEVANIIHQQFTVRHKFEMNFKFKETRYDPQYDGVFQKHSDTSRWIKLMGKNGVVPKTIELDEGLKKTVDWFLLNKDNKR